MSLVVGTSMRTVKDMELIPLGDCAVLAVVKAKNEEVALDEVAKLARALDAEPLAGVTDIVPSYSTVTVHYDPVKVIGNGVTPATAVMEWMQKVTPASTRRTPKPREITLPVCYGGEAGPDIAEVAARAKISEAEVIRVHTKATYRVAALGFSPGFPYLTGMAPRLATPRKATPRVSVPAGSVGIGGGQTGVYPLPTPGGWSLIGRTPARLFRPENEAEPALLAAGDIVRFTSITAKQAQQLEEKDVVLPAPKVSRSSAVLEVIKPGVLTGVQDLGRAGWQHWGISAGGAMDRRAARVANVLLGNDENDPLLEATHTGPEVRFLRDTWIAVTGAEVKGVAGWRPVKVSAGQVVSLAEITRGARVYLAVAGGFEVPRVLGGTGLVPRAGVGGWNGRALQAGDRLGAKPATLESNGTWSASSEFDGATSADVSVRVIKGPQWDWFSAASRRTLLAKPYKVADKSDRIGLRLDGTALRLDDEGREQVSEGVGFGSVQVPPDGKPIVLMADRQTIGGYPKIAHVIAVDLPKLAQARPGALVKFQEITLAEAQALLGEEEHSFALLAAGVRARIKRS